jgi:hypothetical protein
MRFTVPAIIMWTIGALLSIVLGVQPVLAACTNNNQCPSDKTCQNSECKELLLCNFSFDASRFAERSDMCPSGRPSCSGGTCIALASSGGGGGGGGQSGVGQACGLVTIGQVTKPKGCKPGLQCVKVPASSSSGTCRELPK